MSDARNLPGNGADDHQAAGAGLGGLPALEEDGCISDRRGYGRILRKNSRKRIPGNCDATNAFTEHRKFRCLTLHENEQRYCAAYRTFRTVQLPGGTLLWYLARSTASWQPESMRFTSTAEFEAEMPEVVRIAKCLLTEMWIILSAKSHDI